MHLKIAPHWHPHCHHYSFHHPYQQCGTHSVGGQSSHFHGAFLASPLTLTSPYLLLPSFQFLSFMSDISMLCPLVPYPLSFLVFFSLSLPASWESLMRYTTVWRKKIEEDKRAYPRLKPSSGLSKHTDTEDLMTSIITKTT